MSLPVTEQAYQDCKDIFERAIAAPHGIRIRQPSYGLAMMLRLRLHKFRSIVRQNNALMFDFGHAMHGASEFDNYSCRLREDASGTTWVYIEPHEAPDISDIEDLATPRASLALQSREAQAKPAQVVDAAPLQITHSPLRRI